MGARELKGGKSDREFAHVIEEINEFFLHEAKRLNMTSIPKMPNPEATGKKLIAMLLKGAEMSTDKKVQHEMKRELGNMRYDIIKDAHRAERDLKRMAGTIKSPQDLIMKLNKLKGAMKKGELDRDFEHAARGLKEMGGNTNKDEVK